MALSRRRSPATSGVWPFLPDAPFGVDDWETDPRFFGSDVHPAAPPDAWLGSFRTHLSLRRANATDLVQRSNARDWLARQTERQAPYLSLFRNLRSDEDEDRYAALYVLVFPGETTDNTGTKDLNDKVIGYSLNAQYVVERNKTIRTMFDSPDSPFHVISQTYKTTLFGVTEVTERTPALFERAMADMDDAFRALLLKYVQKFLDEATDETSQDRIDAAEDLKKKLSDPDYQFEMFYGSARLQSLGSTAAVVYRGSSDSTKAAGMARTVWKQQSGGTNTPLRGRAFEFDEYRKFAASSRRLQQEIKRTNGGKITVDGVPADVFVRVDGEEVPNRHVLRDARKNKIKVKPGTPAEKQLGLIRRYMSVLNSMDFLKEFDSRPEFPGDVDAQLDLGRTHALALEGPIKKSVDRRAITRFLRQDLRGEVTPAQGRASEYLFFTEAANHQDRLIVSLDIRDLGLDVLLRYRDAIEKVISSTEGRLLEITLASTDPIVRAKREAFELVKEVFRSMFATIRRTVREGAYGWDRLDRLWDRPSGHHQREARRYARGETGDEPAFLLGGDEVIVAAHPVYLPWIPVMLGAICPPRALGGANVRAGVVLSRAEHRRGRRPEWENAIAHARALKAADAAPDLLKGFERDQHRLTRRIDRVPDAEKRAAFSKRLRELALMDLYAEVGRHQIDSLLRLAAAGRLERMAEEQERFPIQVRRLVSGEAPDLVVLHESIMKLQDDIIAATD